MARHVKEEGGIALKWRENRVVWVATGKALTRKAKPIGISWTTSSAKRREGKKGAMEKIQFAGAKGAFSLSGVGFNSNIARGSSVELKGRGVS